MKEDGLWENSPGGEYTLPVCDVQTERRNFPGYKEYPNMLSFTDEGGTTETDSVTDPAGSGGYSTINSGKKTRRQI